MTTSEKFSCQSCPNLSIVITLTYQKGCSRQQNKCRCIRWQPNYLIKNQGLTMNNKQFINLSPSPSSLIESLRHIGYSTETAVADIIDNSITAKAKKIWVRFSWNFGDPWVAIIDDGCGMSKQELIQNMKFGSINPLEKRSREDLGRFGLGMKTASISQCKRLIIASKKDGKLSACDWDIDRLQANPDDEWQLGIIDREDMKTNKILEDLYQEKLGKLSSGTIVLWQCLDRIEELSTVVEREKYFNSLMDFTRKHLELVFHRFILPDSIGGRRVTISMNENELMAFNPFNTRNLATQELPEQIFYLEGSKILVQPYVMPHYNKVSKEEYEKYAGEGGYLNSQGFYIYRNKRLIIWGTWFRLIKKSELNQLLRVRVDIPNTLDHLWKIDVKKSNASPPESVLKELRQVIEKIEIAGKKVYWQKGQRLSSSVKVPIWLRRSANETIFYEINRNYPLLEKLSIVIPPQHKHLIDDTISIIEKSFPRDIFFNDLAQSPEKVHGFEYDKEILEKLVDAYIPLLQINCKSNHEKIKLLLETDPFALNKETVISILKERGIIDE